MTMETDAPRHPVLALPFVRDLAPFPDPLHPGTTKSRSFWSVDGRGLDYLSACNVGVALGIEAIRYAAAHGSGVTGWAAFEMAATRNRSPGDRGLQVGFFHALDRFAFFAGPLLPAFERASAAMDREGLKALAALSADRRGHVRG
jgi:hypothetical protein